MQQQCKNVCYKFYKETKINLNIFNLREVCKNEFIIPLGPELKELYSDYEMCHSLRSLRTESILPQMKMTEIA